MRATSRRVEKHDPDSTIKTAIVFDQPPNGEKEPTLVNPYRCRGIISLKEVGWGGEVWRMGTWEGWGGEGVGLGWGRNEIIKGSQKVSQSPKRVSTWSK